MKFTVKPLGWFLASMLAVGICIWGFEQASAYRIRANPLVFIAIGALYHFFWAISYVLMVRNLRPWWGYLVAPLLGYFLGLELYAAFTDSMASHWGNPKEHIVTVAIRLAASAIVVVPTFLLVVGIRRIIESSGSEKGF